MDNEAAITREFWEELSRDRLMMVGLVDEDGHSRPMTAYFEDGRAPIYFFGSAETEFVRSIRVPQRGFASYASRHQTIYASVMGQFSLNHDPAMIDRFWNNDVATWYEHGKSDPMVQLIQFDCDHAEIWRSKSSFVAGFKALFGMDPRDHAGAVAHVEL